MPPVDVRFASAGDLTAVCELVNHYIATSTFLFRTAPQRPEEWHADWAQHHARYPWLVATDQGQVVGVAYAGPWKARAAYDWCAEVTLYVAHGHARRGIGRRLYARLLDLLDRQGHHTQVAVIALPNAPSVAVHETFGFQHAGTLREVGHKHGTWRDVGFWQRRAAPSDQPAAPLLPVPGLADHER